MNGDPTEPAPPARATLRDHALRYIRRFDEGEVIRWAFRGLLAGTIGVLAFDLYDLSERNAAAPDIARPASIAEPVLPPVTRTSLPTERQNDPRRNVTVDDDLLRQPMRFELAPGGVLSAVGSIDLGANQRFVQEIATRGEYVKTVSLNSPGGSLDDAMAMARLIREKGLATEVTDGALCASSCPLVLAGGKARHVSDKAAIGVHQFYAAGERTTGPAEAMSDAQATTARISRHLADLGVDPALWLHALDTPPQALYYLSNDEMSGYRLVTDAAKVTAKKQPKS